MNTKEMMVAIVTATMVIAMFVSSAMAINVDGVASSGEWNKYDEKIIDTDPKPICSTGYDVTVLYMRVVDGTLFVRMDVAGVPGDADTDGNDTTNTNTHGPCGCPTTEDNEYPGVGIGAGALFATVEEYIVKIDGDHDGTYDYDLRYQLGNATLYSSIGTEITGATTAAAHDGVIGGIVELSVKINEHCIIDPANYCVKGKADADCNGNEEKIPEICHFDEPPTAKCSFDTISCGQGELSGTGSSADVVNYSWDFYDDGTYDAYGETALYDIVGTHDVRLMVTDDLGQTDNCTQSVTLTCGPIAVAKADGSDGPVALPAGGKLVTFCGDESYHPDFANGAHIESYHWTILGSDYSTTDKNECFEVFIGTPTTVSLKVVDNFYCEHIDTVTLRVPIIHEPPSDVPIMTPTGIFALIGMLCIVGAGRILTKGRRS